MAKKFAVLIQKGGSGKTTISGVFSYLLAKKNRVLAVDMDSQGNLTEWLTQRDIYDFTENTVFQALVGLNARKYIYKINDNLDILPAEDYLAYFSKWLYQADIKEPLMRLKQMLAKVENNYDYIIIDCPPNIGEHTLNALNAADYAIIPVECGRFCYSALDRVMGLIEGGIQENYNKDLKVAGILVNIMDSRLSADDTILQKVKQKYGDLVFNTLLYRRSKIKEWHLLGISEATTADRMALKMYKNALNEMMGRINIEQK